MVKNAQCFLAVIPTRGAWGKGESLDEAVKNCKREAGTPPREKIAMTIVVFECTKTALDVRGDVTLNYFFPKDSAALRFQVSL